MPPNQASPWAFAVVPGTILWFLANAHRGGESCIGASLPPPRLPGMKAEAVLRPPMCLCKGLKGRLSHTWSSAGETQVCDGAHLCLCLRSLQWMDRPLDITGLIFAAPPFDPVNPIRAPQELLWPHPKLASQQPWVFLVPDPTEQSNVPSSAYLLGTLSTQEPLHILCAPPLSWITRSWIAAGSTPRTDRLEEATAPERLAPESKFMGRSGLR